MPRRTRLDAELVRRGLARSREQAQALVEAGRVTVGGSPALKAASQVEPSTSIRISGTDADPGYASRGAYKLLSALDTFGPQGLAVEGRHCLDAGASTGGFTDVLLRRGAASVLAVDVGYGLLAWPLRQDPRVTLLERTNVRHLEPESLPGPAPELLVADLSFISLRLVIPALVRCAAAGADLLLMVKPQFEVGRERLGSGGVVRDPGERARAVSEVASGAVTSGLSVRGVTASQLPGPSGNVEYFLWLQKRPPSDGVTGLSAADLERAIEEGPR